MYKLCHIASYSLTDNSHHDLLRPHISRHSVCSVISYNRSWSHSSNAWRLKRLASVYNTHDDCTSHAAQRRSSHEISVGLHYFDLLWSGRTTCCDNMLYNKHTTNRNNVAYSKLHCFDLLWICRTASCTTNQQQVHNKSTASCMQQSAKSYSKSHNLL